MQTAAAGDARAGAPAGAAPARAPPRRIVLCADDYGISPAVDAAIRDLVLNGRLNATSAMVVAPSLSRAEAASLAMLNAGERRCAIGLHLTLTAPFRPLTAGFVPKRDGAFLPLPAMLTRALLRRLDREAISAEVDAQVAAFSAVFGHPPDFIDGHHHVQLFPVVRDAVLAAAKEIGAWARQCASALPLSQRLGDRKGLVIDALSRTFRRRARALGVATNPAFAGTYAYVPDADFATLFPKFLDSLPDGAVIMCHPGRVDAELLRVDLLTHLREKEYAYFASDAFIAALAAHHVQLA